VSSRVRTVSAALAGVAGLAVVGAARVGVRTDVEACRRIDPIERACVFLSPALYEFSAFKGGSAGLRWEFGP
jgi:hypothetical protein